MTQPTKYCGSEPPAVLTDPTNGHQWTPGDCCCTLAAGHNGLCTCGPCHERTGLPGWNATTDLLEQQPAECLLDACTQQCTTECREVINRVWYTLRGLPIPVGHCGRAQAHPAHKAMRGRSVSQCPGTAAEPAPARHTVDTLTSDALDQLYAAVQRLNRRAQKAEAENASYRRAVAQWDVSERGTYIPHASLVAIGRAAGTDVLGSVRYLKHFERVEQAEAAIERARAELVPVAEAPLPVGYDDSEKDVRDFAHDILAALHEQQEQQPNPAKEN